MDKNNNPFANVRKIVAQAVAFILLFVVTLSCESPEEKRPLSSENELISISFEGVEILELDIRRFLEPLWTDFEIFDSYTNVFVTVAEGTDITALLPRIEISPRATIKQIHPRVAPGVVVEDFTMNVIYTITAEDGTTNSVAVGILRTQPLEESAQLRSSLPVVHTVRINVIAYPLASGGTSPAIVRLHRVIQTT